MKNLLLFTLFISFMFGCKPQTKSDTAKANQQTTKVLFQVKTTNKEDLEIFEDGIIPWISIKDPQSEINSLIGKDEIVINHTHLSVLIDYPLNNPVEIKIVSETSKGFSRKELILKISSEYNRIYKEEEESTQIKTTPLKERKGLINRNPTNGIYGIWGHDIDDLDLSAIIVKKNNNGEIKLELFIES